MKILIVDDEADIRSIARLALTTVGKMEVVDVAHGEDARAKAEKELPDAILLDVKMPGMDGVATLRALKASPPTAAIPVIFLTAHTQSAEIRRLLDVGASGVLTKPFDPMRLAEQIRAILEGM